MEKWRDYRRCQSKRIFQKDEPPRRIRNLCGQVGMGAGNCSALLQKIIDYAKEHTIELINLEVRSDNIRAIHVYEKYGFRKIGTSPAYFKIDGEYYDFDLMVLDLR